MASRHTLAREVSVQGVTLHAGFPSRLRLLPAAPGTGIEFRRVDLKGSAPIPALWSNVAETRLGTVLRGPDGASVGVIEHLMSALAGAGDRRLHDRGGRPRAADPRWRCALFLVLDRQGGTRAQGNARGDPPQPPGRGRVRFGEREASAGGKRRSSTSRSSSRPRSSDGRNFPARFDRETFRREIAPARTFGFLKEAEQLRAAGYGRGADLTNTLVIDGDTLMNRGAAALPGRVRPPQDPGRGGRSETRGASRHRAFRGPEIQPCAEQSAACGRFLPTLRTTGSSRPEP